MKKNIILNGTKLESYLIDTKGNIWNIEGQQLTAHKTYNGYLRVRLQRGCKRAMYLVHRLVAETFIENPLGYPIVNHKDSIRDNNNADNLEWCNNSHNQKQRFIQGGKIATSKAVLQLSLKGELIKEWETGRLASKETGVQAQNISKVCRGIRPTAGGYKWSFKE